jgi:hypothetical protein
MSWLSVTRNGYSGSLLRLLKIIESSLYLSDALMPKESLLWKQLRVNSTGIHWQRIESGATASGIPDVNGCFEGREIWVELKVVRGNKIGSDGQCSVHGSTLEQVMAGNVMFSLRKIKRLRYLKSPQI